MTLHDDHSDENLIETPSEDHSQETPDQTEAAAKAQRHAQQIAGKQKQLLEAQVKLAKLDANNLLELAKEDPRLADEVAKQFNYPSFEEAKKTIIAGTKVEAKEADDFDAKYERKRAIERHEEALQVAEDIIAKLPEEKQSEAKAYFAEIAEGKMLNVTSATKFAKMTTLFVSSDKIKAEKRDEGLAAYGSTGVTKTAKSTESKEDFQRLDIDDRGNLVLRSNK